MIGRATTLVLDRNATWSNQHGFVVSPRFHIPGDISVQPSVARSVYRSSGNRERIGYIGAVSNNTTSSSTITYKASGGNVYDLKDAILANFKNKAGWLEYNMKRVCKIECVDDEEQKLGKKEVIRVINEIIKFYDIMKDIRVEDY